MMLSSNNRALQLFCYNQSVALKAIIIAAIHFTTMANAQTLSLEEVIVTANKKDEMLQDVASTVNVITAQTISQFNVFDFSDLQTLTPGLSLTTPDPRTFAISLRGVPYDPDSNAPETVVVYWNGMAVRSNVAFNQLFDLERVEILRGSQGTLQGETSPSGSIHLYTKQGNPNRFSAQLRQSIAEHNNTITDFGVNLPLIADILAIRIAGAYNRDNLSELSSPANHLDASSNSSAGRINLYWTPANNLQTSLTVQYQERSTDALQAVEGKNSLNGSATYLGSYDRTSLQEGASAAEIRNELVSLTIDYNIFEHTLSSVTGYQDNLNYTNMDLDIGNIFPGTHRDQLVETHYETFTQELRLTNEEADYWEYITGLYFYDSRSSTVNDNITFNGFSYNPALGPLFSTPVPGSPLAPAARGYGDSNLLVSYTRSIIPADAKSYGIFLDNTFYLTDSTKLQAGVRWYKRKALQAIDTFATADLRVPVPGSFPDTIVAIGAGMPITAGIGIPEQQRSDTTQTITGSLKLSYDINEQITAYSSYNRGFRPGSIAISPSIAITDLSLLLYDEENSDSFEIGFKSILDNGRYQINGALYYQQFDGFINRATNLFIASTEGSVLDTLVLGGINYNADAIIRGAELESNAIINKNWVWFTSVSYNDAKLDNASVPCGNPGDAADPFSQIKTCTSSGRLGPEPNWSISTSTQYTFPDLIGSAEGYIRALYKFTDNRTDDFASVNPNLYDSYNLPGYGVTDLYIGLKAHDNRWDISVWSKNLFDKAAKTDIGAQEIQAGINLAGGPALLESGYSTVAVIPGQIIGITGSYRLGKL